MITFVYHVVLKTKLVIHMCTKIILMRGHFDYICVSCCAEDKADDTHLYKNYLDKIPF